MEMTEERLEILTDTYPQYYLNMFEQMGKTKGKWLFITTHKETISRFFNFKEHFCSTNRSTVNNWSVTLGQTLQQHIHIGVGDYD